MTFPFPLKRPSVYVLLPFVLILAGCTTEDPVAIERSALHASVDPAEPLLKKTNTPFPDLIPLPDGFRPEGIVVGDGTTFYAGSLADGSIYRGDLRTGEGEIMFTPSDERVAVGLAFDRRTKQLFVAGQRTGMAYVYDGQTGEALASYQLTTGNSFINDVVVTREAAFFTDSFRPVIYRLPLGSGGQLPDPGASEEVPLTGDFTFKGGEFNANGIDTTPNGKHLILVHSSLGALYRVDPATGTAALIDLSSGAVPNGDGILLDGRTLYVVQNFLNQIAVVRLAPDLGSGSITQTITSSEFRIPTTIAEFGNVLYAVNARFDVDPDPDTEYEVVRVPKK